MKHEVDISVAIAETKKKQVLNKPFRTPGGPKKFSVYVKNDKGNIVKVNFGDPNMEIKRDDPERRKNFRARHGCDNPGPKWKARYWSCKMWSTKPVSKLTSRSSDEAAVEEKACSLNQLSDYYYEKPVLVDSSEDWDGYSFYSEEEILKAMPELRNVDPTFDDEMVVNNGPEHPYDSPINPERKCCDPTDTK